MSDWRNERAARNLVVIEAVVGTIQCAVALSPDGNVFNWVAAMVAWVLAAVGYVVLMPNE
jgi:hypothetical protein